MLKKGKYFEVKAKRLLQLRMWRIIQENYRCRFGEIDLIAQNFRKTHIIFVEVRYRHNQSHGGSIESIDLPKQRKIIKTAEHFLMLNSHFYDCILRFDAICFDRDNKFEWIQDAFRVE
jgi:putative endonuclease